MTPAEIKDEIAYRIAEREAILSDGGPVTQQMREKEAQQWLNRYELSQVEI